jgi:hypothetical protein
MPDDAFSAIEHWRRHTLQLTGGLLQRVEELSVSDYPASTPSEVIRFLQAFLAELTGVIDRASSEERLKIVSSLVQQLGMFIEWLDNAHTGQTPRGLAKVLRDLIVRLDPGARVVARPQAKYNYSILDLGQLLKRLVVDFVPQSKHAAFDQYLASPIKLISFPRIERDNLLGHAVFGHELGHPIADEYLAQEEAEDSYKQSQADIQKKVLELVEERHGAGLDQAVKLEVSTRYFNHILQIRRRALEEIISDAVGLLIFGPSAFFAMFELLWNSSWDARPSPEEWYPPPRFRLRLMLQILDDAKTWDRLIKLEGDRRTARYHAAMMMFAAEARRHAEEKSDISAINEDRLVELSYAWMNASLARALEFARSKTAGVAFDIDAATGQLPELIQRLELGVPPNEIGDPLRPQAVDYRTSLLAGWLFKLYGVNSSTGEPLSSKDINRLNMQTLLAVEYVTLRGEYTEHLEKARKGSLS